MPDSQKRVLMVQENMQPPGGGQGVAAWAVQVLAGDYALDLLSWVPVETEAINRYYGTSLDAAGFSVLEFPASLRRIVDLDRDPYSFQPLAFLMRRTRQIASRYDVIIGFCNEMDYGVPGIQYLHYPYLHPKYLRLSNTRQPWSARVWDHINFYFRPWRMLSGFRFRSVKQNLTLVNSDWTGERVRATYGIPTRTLYPPVVGNFSAHPWSERENGFVCIGRLVPEKEYEQILEILEQVRERGHPIHLHLVLSIPSVHFDQEYIAKIRALVEFHAAWVHWHENISRRELEQLIATHRYGIHAMAREHFGMGIAEMLRGGCIPFVPNSGGQVEIVGGDPQLTYDSVEEAVEKISCVLDDAGKRVALQARLAARAGLFSTERYMRELRDIIAAQVHSAPARGFGAE